MDTISSLPDHRRVRMAIQSWLQWPIETLFKATRIRKIAKVPTVAALSKTRMRATNSNDLYKSASFEIEQASSNNELVMMDYTTNPQTNTAAKLGDAGFPCTSFESITSSNDLDVSIVSDMLSKVSISPPQSITTSSCCLSTLPTPKFQTTNMSVAVQDPVKHSSNLLECRSLPPDSQANYNKNEPRGWKRKSPDDARPLSPQPEKYPLRSPRSPRSTSCKTVIPVFFTDYSFIPGYKEPRPTVSASEVHVKRCSPETCFSCNERPEKRAKYEDEVTMDVENAFLGNTDVSINIRPTIPRKGTEIYRIITAGYSMQDQGGQVDGIVPEVEMSDDDDDSDDDDEDDVQMELDDAVFDVTSFQQAAGDGWMWVK